MPKEIRCRWNRGQHYLYAMQLSEFDYVRNIALDLLVGFAPSGLGNIVGAGHNMDDARLEIDHVGSKSGGVFVGSIDH